MCMSQIVVIQVCFSSVQHRRGRACIHGLSLGMRSRSSKQSFLSDSSADCTGCCLFCENLSHFSSPAAVQRKASKDLLLVVHVARPRYVQHAIHGDVQHGIFSDSVVFQEPAAICHLSIFAPPFPDKSFVHQSHIAISATNVAPHLRSRPASIFGLASGGEAPGCGGRVQHPVRPQPRQRGILHHRGEKGWGGSVLRCSSGLRHHIPCLGRCLFARAGECARKLVATGVMPLNGH